MTALASAGGAALSAAGGVALGHPTAGLVVAGSVMIAPWVLAVIPVATAAAVALAARHRNDASTQTVEVIDALRRLVDSILGR